MAITRRHTVELALDSFTRLDDTEDRLYYAVHGNDCRFAGAPAAKAAKLIQSLISLRSPAILDLMAGADSHVDGDIAPSRLVGIGLSAEAMQENPMLSERIIQDLGEDPRFPYDDQSFDVALSTAAIPYLTRPLEVLAEVARILKPGGLLLVVFDNRLREQRAVKVWRRASEEERLALVDHLIQRTASFQTPQVRLTKVLGTEDGSDSRPLYAVLAVKHGGDPRQVLAPTTQAEEAPRYSKEQVAERKRMICHTMCCPYCDEPLIRHKVPDTPFNEWDAEYLWVCFSPRCPFTTRSLAIMREQGNLGVSYRLMYHRERDRVYTVPDVGFCDTG
jgi:SAM-dependent methyltransferase